MASKPVTPKAVILDWGGVVCEDPSPGFVRRCSEKLNLDPRVLGPAIARRLEAFMKGATEPEFWAAVTNDLGTDPPQSPLWGEALAAVYRPLDETIAIAHALKRQGILLGLLTNTEPPSKRFHLSLGYDFFTARVFSCEENLAKPDPRIYELMALRLGLAPEECLMVDDKAENIQGAQDARMPGHLFTTSGQFKAELTRLGLLPIEA